MTARPAVIAHRAGNRPDALAAAAGLGVDVVELDVHGHRGRLEVRHTKSMGPWPLLWDRWYLADGLAPVPLLEDVLEALAARDRPPALMIDMKGGDPRLPGMVADALRRSPFRGRVLACSRVWRSLRVVADRAGAVPVHSAGSPRQLARLLARFPEDGDGLQGVSVHRRLLDPATVAALRRRTGLVMSWPVNTRPDADRLAGWGVTGLITDVPGLLVAGGPGPAEEGADPRGPRPAPG